MNGPSSPGLGGRRFWKAGKQTTGRGAAHTMAALAARTPENSPPTSPCLLLLRLLLRLLLFFFVFFFYFLFFFCFILGLLLLCVFFEFYSFPFFFSSCLLPVLFFKLFFLPFSVCSSRRRMQSRGNREGTEIGGILEENRDSNYKMIKQRRWRRRKTISL